MTNIEYILLSVLAVSLISLIGIFTISLKENLLKKILPLLVALSTGSLLGGFFMHILPELAEENFDFKILSLFILTGIFIFYFMEKLIH